MNAQLATPPVRRGGSCGHAKLVLVGYWDPSVVIEGSAVSVVSSIGHVPGSTKWDAADFRDALCHRSPESIYAATVSGACLLRMICFAMVAGPVGGHQRPASSPSMPLSRLAELSWKARRVRQEYHQHARRRGLLKRTSRSCRKSGSRLPLPARHQPVLTLMRRTRAPYRSGATPAPADGAGRRQPLRTA